jgi:hypothetical protein
MGQFKPMVKMETTEPSVILHLKKGGSAKMPVRKMDGGTMGAAGPVTPVANPAAARAMAARRVARTPSPMTNPTAPGRMPMPAAPMGRPMMKEGGSMDKAQDKAMIKKAFKQHDMQEHKGGKGTSLKLKNGGMMKCATGGSIPSESISGSPAKTIVDTGKRDNAPANTGGVRNGNAGGFKKGGMTKKFDTGGAIVSEKTSGAYAKTQMNTSKPDNAPAKTGVVKKGNAGGFATGGVMKANSGGYRKGGAAKKFAEGGRVQDDGGPEQMKQGRKPMSAPVAISMLSGTYKKGGKVAPNNAKLQAFNNAEFAPTMKATKKDSNLKYGPTRNFMMPKKAGGAC